MGKKNKNKIIFGCCLTLRKCILLLNLKCLQIGCKNDLMQHVFSFQNHNETMAHCTFGTSFIRQVYIQKMWSIGVYFCYKIQYATINTTISCGKVQSNVKQIHSVT